MRGQREFTSGRTLLLSPQPTTPSCPWVAPGLCTVFHTEWPNAPDLFRSKYFGLAYAC